MEIYQRLLIIASICIILCFTITNANSSKKMSILFLLVDDGGFQLGLYDDNVTATPNIDALGRRSGAVIYDNAYTAVSSCSPSRSAILTGLPTHQNGMYGLHQYPGNFQSNSDVLSLPNLLNKHNYTTGIIGKYHVGPVDNYNFTYGLGYHGDDCWAGASQPCKSDYNQVSRNITNMKNYANEFFSKLQPSDPFFLYVGFGDTHRCHENSTIGTFCEYFGSGKNDQGIIPDWKPKWFTKEEMIVPKFLPDNDLVRDDLARFYTAVNRMDQGVGLILNELKIAGRVDDTLIIFFSDNGLPFPSGKTNLFTNQGQGEPCIVVNPLSTTPAHRSKQIVSSLDFAVTILDAVKMRYPTHAKAGHKPAILTGMSLLSSSFNVDKPAFASHQFHSLYCYYPMRSITSGNYRLVHNLNYNLEYGILEDVYNTPTWAKLMADGESGKPTGWIYDYNKYMKRPEWELYDLEADPLSLHNQASNTEKYGKIFSDLQNALNEWRQVTNDPWFDCDKPTTAHICSI